MENTIATEQGFRVLINLSLEIGRVHTDQKDITSPEINLLVVDVYLISMYILSHSN